MTIDQLAEYLLEGDTTTDGELLDDKVKTFVDRLLMRFYMSPSLLAFLENVNVVKEGGSNYDIELSFRRFPQEQVLAVRKLIGEKRVKVYQFEHKGAPHFGFKVSLTQDDLTPPNPD